MITGKKIIKTPKPVVLPNDFAKSSGNTIEMYIWANGKNISTTCHSGRPTICIITTMLYIGTNRPAWLASLSEDSPHGDNH